MNDDPQLEAVKAAAESAIRSLIWHWPYNYKILLGKGKFKKVTIQLRAIYFQMKNKNLKM